MESSSYTDRYLAMPCRLCRAPEETVHHHLVTACTHPQLIYFQGWMGPRLVEHNRCVTLGARAALLRANLHEAQLSAAELLEYDKVLTQPLDTTSASYRFTLY